MSVFKLLIESNLTKATIESTFILKYTFVTLTVACLVPPKVQDLQHKQI